LKISIITVCYNASSVIRGALDSVAKQSYPYIEHILIDGNSTDGTVKTIHSYPHVAALVSEPDRGIYDAMNKGVTRATGDFLLFLNADDRLPSPNTIFECVKKIEQDPGADVYYGWLEVRPIHGEPHIFRPPPPSEAPAFLVTGCLPHQSTLARPSVFQVTGLFDIQYRYHADYDWFLKVLSSQNLDVRLLPCVIGSFLEGGASSQLDKGQPEIFRIQNSSNLFSGTDWDRKRIDELQAAWLRERITSADLRKSILNAELNSGRNVEGETCSDQDSRIFPAAGPSKQFSQLAKYVTKRHRYLIGAKVKEIIRLHPSDHWKIAQAVIGSTSLVILIWGIFSSFGMAGRSLNFWFDESGQLLLALGQNHFSPASTPIGSVLDSWEQSKTMNADPGGFTLIVRFVAEAFGTAPGTLRSIPFVFSIVGLSALVWIGRALRLSLSFALLAPLVMLASSDYLLYMFELRGYSMECSGVIAVVAAAMLLLKHRNSFAFAAFSIAMILFSLSRYSFALYEAAISIAIAIYSLRRSNRDYLTPTFVICLAISLNAIIYFGMLRYQIAAGNGVHEYIAQYTLKGKGFEQAKEILKANFLDLSMLPKTILMLLTLCKHVTWL